MSALNEAYPLKLWWSIATTLLSSYQFGYQVAVLNTCVDHVSKSIDYDNEIALNSAVILGAAFGAITAGVVADALGPKRAQTLNVLNFLLGTMLSGFAHCWWTFLAGRVIAGIGAGASSLYAPRYIAEVAPRELRGSLGTQHQVFINLGILVAYFMGLPYEYDLEGVDMLEVEVPWWRIMILVGVLPAVIQFFCLFSCPESPVWLEPRDKEVADESCIQLWGSRAILYEAVPDADEGNAGLLAGLPLGSASPWGDTGPPSGSLGAAPAGHVNGGAGAARRSLNGGTTRSSITSHPIVMASGSQQGAAGAGGAGVEQLNGMEHVFDAAIAEVAAQQQAQQGVMEVPHGPLQESWFGMFRHRYKWMLALALGLPVLQQASGINTVILFSSVVFQDSGLTSPIWGSIIMGSVNLAFTMVAGVVMDRIGRRPLMLTSYAGMAVCLLGVSVLNWGEIGAVPISPTSEDVGLWTAALVIAYALFFALGAGPVTWLYLSEILPPAIKGKAAALATFLCWVGNLAVALSFYPMLQGLGIGGSYMIYAALNVVALVALHCYMVETKCRSLRDIEALLALAPKPRLRSLFQRPSQNEGATSAVAPAAPLLYGAHASAGNGMHASLYGSYNPPGGPLPPYPPSLPYGSSGSPGSIGSAVPTGVYGPGVLGVLGGVPGSIGGTGGTGPSSAHLPVAMYYTSRESGMVFQPASMPDSQQPLLQFQDDPA